MLSDKQLNDVCLFEKGHRTCRYLVSEDTMPGIYACGKKDPVIKVTLDDMHAKYVQRCLESGVDPSKSNVPTSDNCEGYILLFHVLQGYDQ